MKEENEKLKNEIVRAKKSRRAIIHNMLGMEQRMAYLQEQNTTLTHENTSLKDDIMKIEGYVKGLEWDIEAICGYLEKKQEKDE